MACKEEQETIIRINQAEKSEGTIEVYSSYAPHIRKIRKVFAHAIVNELARGEDSVIFTLKAELWRDTFRLIPHKRVMSESQKAEMVERGKELQRKLKQKQSSLG